MRAAWYKRQGPAAEVLHVGELPTPEPTAGEVRVRLQLSGVNPGDVKKREGWLGSAMPYPQVIPHSDGAGVIEAVGLGADESRIGRRVWVYGAQSYRPSGTAAEATVVPEAQAVDLPETVSAELGAALGIPGITAHRAVFADGPVTGSTVLVQGVLGAVGSLAAQLAHCSGATVIGTIRHNGDTPTWMPDVVSHLVPLDGSDPIAQIRAVAPSGVDRIVEVALSANADFDAEVIAQGGVIAAYSSPAPRPSLPFWPLLFSNVSLRLLGSDDFPFEAKQLAVRDLTAAAAAGQLQLSVAPPYPLDNIAAAHQAVEAGSRDGRIFVLTGG